MDPRRNIVVGVCAAVCLALVGCGGSDASHSACVRARAAEAGYKLATARMGLKFGQIKYEEPLFNASAALRGALTEVARIKKGIVPEQVEQINEVLLRQDALLHALRAHDTKTVHLVSKDLNTHLREALIQIEIICPSAK